MFIYKYWDKEVFLYFVSLMIRIKLLLGCILVIGCDRDRVVKNGLVFYFFCVVFLVCKKYFEDDILWKFIELGLNGNEWS